MREAKDWVNEADFEELTDYDSDADEYHMAFPRVLHPINLTAFVQKIQEDVVSDYIGLIKEVTEAAEIKAQREAAEEITKLKAIGKKLFWALAKCRGELYDQESTSESRQYILEENSSPKIAEELGITEIDICDALEIE